MGRRLCNFHVARLLCCFWVGGRSLRGRGSPQRLHRRRLRVGRHTVPGGSTQVDGTDKLKNNRVEAPGAKKSYPGSQRIACFLSREGKRTKVDAKTRVHAVVSRLHGNPTCCVAFPSADAKMPFLGITSLRPGVETAPFLDSLACRTRVRSLAVWRWPALAIAWDSARGFPGRPHATVPLRNPLTSSSSSSEYQTHLLSYDRLPHRNM